MLHNIAPYGSLTLYFMQYTHCCYCCCITVVITDGREPSLIGTSQTRNSELFRTKPISKSRKFAHIRELKVSD